jgi:hypothetical protein
VPELTSAGRPAARGVPDSGSGSELEKPAVSETHLSETPNASSSGLKRKAFRAPKVLNRATRLLERQRRPWVHLEQGVILLPRGQGWSPGRDARRLRSASTSSKTNKGDWFFPNPAGRNG